MAIFVFINATSATFRKSKSVRVLIIFLWTVSVWADDQWLVEHAGATLKNTDGKDTDGEEADSAGEKNTEADTETVSSGCYSHRVIYFTRVNTPIRTAENFEAVEWATGFSIKNGCIKACFSSPTRT